MSKMEQTYLYAVHPKKVIRDLPIAPIRAPKSLQLTKDQVRTCLKSGTVYRRFASENRNERVTICNIDRLHHARYMSEEDYEAFKDQEQNGNRGSVIEEHHSTPSVEESHEETISNEIKEDNPVVEEYEDEVLEEPVEENTEAVVNENDEIVDESTVEDDNLSHRQNRKKKNYGKRR